MGRQGNFSDPYSELRPVLAPEYAGLPPRELEAALSEAMGGVSPRLLAKTWSDMAEAGENLGNVLTGAGAGALQGGAMGAAAGPWGALIGAALGAITGGVQAHQASGRPQRRRQAPPAGAAPAPAPAYASPQPAQNPVPSPAPPPARPSDPAPEPAAAQLLGLLSRPETLHALMALALGQAGAREVTVAGRQVPTAAIANLIGALANRTASGANAQAPAPGSQEVPEYLMDSAGALVCDISDSEERADALLGLMNEQAERDIRGRRSIRERYYRRTPAEGLYEMGEAYLESDPEAVLEQYERMVDED